MAQKHISIFKTDTLELTEGKDGFWLWDNTRQMNLSLREKSEREALVGAIEYYQKRLLEVEGRYSVLCSRVEGFVNLFQDEEEVDLGYD